MLIKIYLAFNSRTYWYTSAATETRSQEWPSLPSSDSTTHALPSVHSYLRVTFLSRPLMGKEGVLLLMLFRFCCLGWGDFIFVWLLLLLLLFCFVCLCFVLVWFGVFWGGGERWGWGVGVLIYQFKFSLIIAFWCLEMPMRSPSCVIQVSRIILYVFKLPVWLTARILPTDISSVSTKKPFGCLS